MLRVALLVSLTASLTACLPSASGDGGGSGGDAPEPVTNPDPPPEGDDLTFAAAAGAPPPLSPELVFWGAVGGSGDQWLEDVYFEDDGRIVASAPAFTVTMDASGTSGVVSGDLDAVMEGRPARPRLPGNPGRAYAHAPSGLTFTVGYRQAGRNLQTPIFRALSGDEVLWRLWGHAGADIENASLGADSRCYQAWGMPDGKIGVQCWTDGGNSVLARDPRDLSVGPGWSEGAWMKGAGGMATLYALIDPTGEGAVESGTFVATHVTHLTTDGWGRVYLARSARNRQTNEEGTDALGVGATSGALGVAVLSPDLSTVLFNANLATECEGTQAFSDIAMRDGLLVLVGSTCSDTLATGSLGSPEGEGQDGVIAVLQMY
jgi:hypothetical protein